MIYKNIYYIKNALKMLCYRAFFEKWCSHTTATWVRPLAEISLGIRDNFLRKIPPNFFQCHEDLLHCEPSLMSKLRFPVFQNCLVCDPLVHCRPIFSLGDLHTLNVMSFSKKNSNWCINICKPSYITKMVKWWKTMVLNGTTTRLSPW